MELLEKTRIGGVKGRALIAWGRCGGTCIVVSHFPFCPPGSVAGFRGYRLGLRKSTETDIKSIYTTYLRSSIHRMTGIYYGPGPSASGAYRGITVEKFFSSQTQTTTHTITTQTIIIMSGPPLHRYNCFFSIFTPPPPLQPKSAHQSTYTPTTAHHTRRSSPHIRLLPANKFLEPQKVHGKLDAVLEVVLRIQSIRTLVLPSPPSLAPKSVNNR